MMEKSAMASFIINHMGDTITDSQEAMNKFYEGLCKYMETNMEIYYTWSAQTPPIASTPDPMVILKCSPITTGMLKPSGASDCNSALQIFSSDLNSQISLWQVSWPIGFAIPPAFILPSITITPSNSDTRQTAFEHICQEIINGVKNATIGPLPGTHLSFTVPTPGAIFQNII